MSHHNNGNNFLLILILCILFPGAAMALGIGIILLWALKILFYILIGIAYLIYMYFWPIFIVGLVIFIIYALSKKQSKKTIDKKESKAPSGDTVLMVTDSKPLIPKNSHLPPSHDEFVDRDYSEGNKYKGGNEFLDEEDDEDVRELMESHDLDRDDAEHVKEIMDDEGLDEEDAVELKDDL